MTHNALKTILQIVPLPETSDYSNNEQEISVIDLNLLNLIDPRMLSSDSSDNDNDNNHQCPPCYDQLQYYCSVENHCPVDALNAFMNTWQQIFQPPSQNGFYVDFSFCCNIWSSWFSLEQNCWFIEDKLSSTAVDFIRSEGIAERQHLIWGKASSLSIPRTYRGVKSVT